MAGSAGDADDRWWRWIPCIICRELFSSEAAECPKCGCPQKVSNPQHSPRQATETYAAVVRDMVTDVRTVNELFDSFLGLVTLAIQGHGGIVWDLEGGSACRWFQDPAMPLVDFDEAAHLEFLWRQPDAPSWVAASADGNTTGYMLVLRPFKSKRIQHGIIELFQRPTAPEAAADGYAMYLDRLAVHLERSPLLAIRAN